MSHSIPLVTIVIPTFNHADFLNQAITSVLDQDYSNIELIVIDDGSQDNSLKILQSHPRRAEFRWFTQANSGQSIALNRGWSIGTGDILGYLSADDVLYTNAVSSLVKSLADNSDAVLSYGNFHLIDNHSSVIREVYPPQFDYCTMVTEFICAPGVGALFWRDPFSKAGGWSPSIHRFPDIECWIRLGIHGRFIKTEDFVGAFRIHDTSQSFSYTPENRALEAITIIRDYYQNIEGIPQEILSKKNYAIANAYLIVAQLGLRSGRYLSSLRYILTAIALAPKSIFHLRFLRMLLNGLFNKSFHRLLRFIRH